MYPAIQEIFLHENNRNYNSYKFSSKFAFILFFSFLTNQKQESGFQEVGDLVTKDVPVFLFIASHALLQRHAEFNRLLERDFLTCYCCSCYSSMGIEGNLLILFKNYLKDCKQRVVLNGQTSSKQNTLLVYHNVPF